MSPCRLVLVCRDWRGSLELLEILGEARCKRIPRWRIGWFIARGHVPNTSSRVAVISLGYGGLVHQCAGDCPTGLGRESHSCSFCSARMAVQRAFGLKPVTQATSRARTAGARLPTLSPTRSRSKTRRGLSAFPAAARNSIARGEAHQPSRVAWYSGRRLAIRCRDSRRLPLKSDVLELLSPVAPSMAFRKVGCGRGRGWPVQAKVAWSGVCGRTHTACPGGVPNAMRECHGRWCTQPQPHPSRPGTHFASWFDVASATSPEASQASSLRRGIALKPAGLSSSRCQVRRQVKDNCGEPFRAGGGRVARSAGTGATWRGENEQGGVCAARLSGGVELSLVELVIGPEGGSSRGVGQREREFGSGWLPMSVLR